MLIRDMPTIFAKKILPNGSFPNNEQLPLLHYKKAFNDSDPHTILAIFSSNGWQQGWIDSIYDFHHFHSNTHEALGIAKGSCDVEIGGPKGVVIHIEAGDLLVIPAGVSHKNIGSTDDFISVGSYPTDVSYDMHEGKMSELEQVKKAISKVAIPKTDPVFGANGPLFNYWVIQK